MVPSIEGWCRWCLVQRDGADGAQYSPFGHLKKHLVCNNYFEPICLVRVGGRALQDGREGVPRVEGGH